MELSSRRRSLPDKKRSASRGRLAWIDRNESEEVRRMKNITSSEMMKVERSQASLVK